MTTPTARVERITPERARELLNLNTENRRLRPSKVRDYARDMTLGRWKLTGESLIMNGTRILNGQHRLHACIEAGVSFETLVVYGISADVMPAIDKGLSRSLADTLGWEGAASRNGAAAITRRLTTLLDGGTLRDLSGYTDADHLETWHAFKDEIAWAERNANRLRSDVGRTVSEWGTTLAWIRLECPQDLPTIDRFVDALCTGAGLNYGDPLLALRNWVVKGVANNRQLRRDELFIAALKTWNAWISGRELRLVKALPSENVPEVVKP